MKTMHWSTYISGKLRAGRRRGRTSLGGLRASGRQRQAGVKPVRAANHRPEVRVRPWKPVRQDPHQPGHLGVRRSGRRRGRDLPDGPELRPADSQSESAQRTSDLRADSKGRRLWRRSIRGVHRGAVGRGNSALGSRRQGAERAGVPVARRQVPRSDSGLLRHRVVSDAAAHARAIRSGRDKGQERWLYRHQVRPGSGRRPQ